MAIGRRDNRGERPYVISYMKAGRKHGISDSARTLEDAKARINHRLSKRRGETAQVWFNGEVVFAAVKAEGR